MFIYTPGPKGVGAFLCGMGACDPACKKYSRSAFRNDPMKVWRTASLEERLWYLEHVYRADGADYACSVDINPAAVKHGLRTVLNAAVRAAWPAYCDANDIPNDTRERILTHIFAPGAYNLADPFFYWRRAAATRNSNLHPVEIITGWSGSVVFCWPWGETRCPAILKPAETNALVLQALPRPPLPGNTPLWLRDKVYDEAQNALGPAL